MKKYRSKIKDNITRTKSGCWEWNRFREVNGYGRTRYLGKNTLVHRMSYTVFRGPIPEGMMVCHRCDNPPCCNPKHLFLGTNKDNQRDAREKGRSTGWPRSAITKARIRKLTHEQVDEIRTSSESTASLAARMGCSYANVYMIRGGLRKVAPRV